MVKKMSFVLVLLLLVIAAVFVVTQKVQPSIQRVIYITLDGTRWQDVLQDKSNFPKFWQEHAANMTIYGVPGDNKTIEVASIPISLPSYQSQMTGKVQPCQNNDCGQVTMQTLPEYLLQALHLNKQQVAVFSSWPVIADALESKSGTVYSNVGNVPVVDPFTGKPDEMMAGINFLQSKQSHYHGNRMDAYTFEQALHYFIKYQPTFLWISLVNGDNEAHDNKLDNYHAVLRQYDNFLNQLFVTLKTMHLDKSTLVIITTDHGRGNDKNWINHGPELPESRATWAFVMNGRLRPDKNDNHYSTLSFRPTIEAALRL